MNKNNSSGNLLIEKIPINHFLLIMRTTIFLLFTCVFCSMAELSYTQNARVTINKRNATIKEILNEIEKQTDYLFIYNDEVNTNEKVSVKAKQEAVSSVLNSMLEDKDMKYSMEGNHIILSTNKNESPENQIEANTQQQQKKRISGTVLDENGQPIIGANIIEVGTTNGTVTDMDGKFTLDVSDNATIRISYIGYLEQEVNTSGKNTLNITLIEDTQRLEEVVVVGYGTQRKINLTGAVDQVTSEVFENRPVANVTQALVGVVPNLNIRLEDGKPNRSAAYNIRGTTSIGQGGSALVLIDGVEGDPALLNPNDIESVSVLKDAASAAIYGARASFGVVLITTKGAPKEKPRVTYNGNFSVLSPTATPNVVTDGYIWAERFREAYYGWYNYSSLPSKINTVQSYSDAWLEDFKKRKEQGIKEEVVINPDGTYTYYGNTDWYDLLYKDYLYSYDHNVTVSGATEKSDFYLSGRLYDYEGLYNYNSDTHKMLNLRAKGSLQVFDWLKIFNNMQFSQSKSHLPITVSEYGYSITRLIEVDAPPVATVYNPDGTFTRASSYTLGDFIYGKNSKNDYQKILRNTTGFSAAFLENKLRINGDFTFSHSNQNQNQRRVPIPYSIKKDEILYTGTKYNDYLEAFQNSFYTATNLYAEYENNFGEDHYFKGMIGYNYETSENKYTSIQRNGLLLEDAEDLNLALGESILPSSSYRKWRIAAGFFRFNYGYKNRYLAEVNGRYDGSSKFPKDHQFAFFPSFSAGWRISEEPFWNIDKEMVSNMKIRVSYGSLGNGNISPYAFQELFSIGTSGRVINGVRNKYTGNPPVIPSNLTWETATTFDIGLDLTLLKDRLSFTGDYYSRKTLDMYTVGMTLPEVFGASSPKGNNADMTTTGWEISVRWNDSFRINNKPFHYSLKATLHDYSSTIDRYYNATNSLSDYYEGMKIGEIWGYKTDGLFQSEEEIQGYVNTIIKSSNNGGIYPGDVKFVDVNKNGKIDYGNKTVDDPGDMVIIGNSSPRYMYSFAFDCNWNNFFFSTFIEGVGKQDWYPSRESLFWGQYNRPYNSLPAWHINNYWTKDNPNAYLPRYAGYNTSLGYGGNTISDRYLQRVSYIRLKNLQIGYNFPQNWISRIKMQNARIYLTGENLWSWSPLYKRTKDFDVLNAISGTESDLSSNFMGDGNSYPLLRNISVGLSFTF